MDNGAGNYQRYLNGDDEGLTDIIRDFSDGLVLYLNGITGNFCLAESLQKRHSSSWP